MHQLTIQNLFVRHIGPVDLAVEGGECVCISGPSGSGKSLLLRAVADLEAHRGQVALGDVRCDSIKAHLWRRQVGMLPAESQWWYAGVGEHFQATDGEWFKQLGFDNSVASWDVARCSTGEKQRLALLRLLCIRPKALLLDEPTASLDRNGVQRAEALIRSYRKEQQAPVIWVSHDPEQIRRVANRHYVLEGKTLVKTQS
ncbi:MAG: ATP-binding cassette domain-containing protein [Pseudomonadota bacterium]|nr:MAG: ATP-binding cassette domain-containing protein [Pseudomonadota bacterium]